MNATDLFELQAKLKLDDSAFNKGIGNAMDAGEKLKSSIGAGAVAIGNLAADMVRKGVSAISGVINGAIDGYANYQQLVGGVETLFKTSASKVQQYAKQSFKTTGLSANDYMETVTSFSASLLQGLNGDTEAAADLANTAITDMADNANKMGTDIQMIQNAYQGFAKGNFTMLDNLKLGYGGTKGEMVRLINDSKILDHEIDNLDDVSFATMIEALHKVQSEMGITGTTAKEAAETISGSKASLQASWKDLLTVVGGAGNDAQIKESMDNFKDSFNAYMVNFIPTLVQTISGSGTLITAIADAIGDLPTNLLSQVSKAGLEAGTDMMGGASKIVNWVIENISSMFRSAKTDGTQIANFGKALGEFLGETLRTLAINAPDIITGAIEAGVALAGGLISGIKIGLFGEGSQVDKITDDLSEKLGAVDLSNTKATALIDYLKSLYESYGTAATKSEEWKYAVSQLDEVLPNAGKTIEGYGSHIGNALQKLEDMNEALRRTTIMNALSAASSEEQVLLAELSLERNKERGRYNTNRDNQLKYEQNVRDAIMKYGAGAADRYLASVGAENVNDLSAAQRTGYNELLNIANGFVAVGDSIVDLKNANWEQLKGVVATLENADLDNVLKTNEQLYQDAQLEMESASARIKELDDEIKATQQAIEETKAAITKTVAELLGGSETVASDVESGGKTIQTALNALGQKIGLWNPYIGYMPKATGIESVPYNGFRAELHRGEGVLTAAQNRAYRNGEGAGSGAVVGAIQEMRQDLQNLRLVVGTRTFGRAVVDYGGGRVDGYIGQAESRLARGYGA